MDKNLWNTRHKLRKAKILLDIENALEQEYKLGIAIFINKIKNRKQEWDVDELGNEISTLKFVSYIHNILENDQDLSFPVREIHVEKIKSILREHKIEGMLDESNLY
jgi:DNA-binding Lrp family transcriptional regulator